MDEFDINCSICICEP